MLIERTDKETIIRIPNSVETEDLEDFIAYIRYKEMSSDVNVSQQTIDKMASDLNVNWWKKNRDKFLK